MSSDNQSLLPPVQHEWSQHLWNAAAAESPSIAESMAAVLSMELCPSGVVKLQVQASSGYDHRPWGLWIGGPGLGSDEDAMWGGPKQAPVAVRFVAPVPFTIVDVDDTGYVSSEFWLGNGSEQLQADGTEPSLRHIVEQAVSWLEGTTVAADKFSDAYAYTIAKKETIESFLSSAAPPAELFGDGASAVLLPNEYWAPPLAPHLADKPQETVIPSDLIQEVSRGVFCFPLFTPAFCSRLVAIVDAYEATALPKRRPNTMNNYGLVINDVGLMPLMDDLLSRVVARLAPQCFPDELFSSSLDHHHSFVVEYKGAELGEGDRKLDMHHDASEVTLNVCLGREGFSASGLRFCGSFGGSDHRRQQYTHSHAIGSAVMHLGRQRHGADQIESGERMNLILWARSSAFRAAAAFQHVPPDGYPAEQEESAPHHLCLSQANDRDYEAQIKAFDATGQTLDPSCAAGRNVRIKR